MVEIERLSKVYRSGSEELEIFREVDLSVTAGSTTIITGESGSGKSTLLNLIGGLDAATSGVIRFKGREITGADEIQLTSYRSREIGFIFQFHYLLKDFTALENVLLPAFIAGTPRKQAVDRAKDLVVSVGLSERVGHYPVELSGGERQRVAVARALMNEPDLILADEPTGNLDERNSQAVEELLFQLVNRYGKTMILVTHDMGLAEGADQHCVLEQGRLRPG